MSASVHRSSSCCWHKNVGDNGWNSNQRAFSFVFTKVYFEKHCWSATFYAVQISVRNYCENCVLSYYYSSHTERPIDVGIWIKIYMMRQILKRNKFLKSMILRKNKLLKRPILKKKLFLKSTILKKKIFLKSTILKKLCTEKSRLASIYPVKCANFCVLRAYLKSTILKERIFLGSTILKNKDFSKSMILKKNFFLKSMVLNEKDFVKSLILK